MPNIKKSKDTGKFVKHATYVKKNCENCGIEFEIKQSSLKYGRGRCCSRTCVDENKKRTYSGQNNPSYGRKQSLEERKKRHASVQAAIKQKYGKTSVELMIEALGNSVETSIEKKLYQSLKNIGIEFEKKYKIWLTDIHYREYDAYIPDLNILIEADGDYWHGNPMKYTEFDQKQIKMKENDLFKEHLAKTHNKFLIRFWETDIVKDDFENKLKEVICQKRK